MPQVALDTTQPLARRPVAAATVGTVPLPSSTVDTIRALRAQFLVGNAAVAAALVGIPPGGLASGGPASLPGQGPGQLGLPVPEPLSIPVGPPAGSPGPAPGPRPGPAPGSPVVGLPVPGPVTPAVPGAPASTAPAVSTVANEVAAAPAAAATAPAVGVAAGEPSPAAAPAAQTVARPRADRDPKFAVLKQDVRAKGHHVSSGHPPARTESGAAQAAAKPPPDDKVAQGKAANADRMNEAEPKPFDKTAFVKAVQQAIAEQAPKNLDEADKFGDSDRPEQVKKDVQGRVAQGKDASANDIATTTAAPPDTSKAVEKKVVPLTPDRPPGTPGTPDPANAVPDKLPPSATDLSAGPRQVNQEMADAQVTEPQLANSNEPTFSGALKQKNTAEQDAARATPAMRQHEAGTLTAATADAQHQGAAGMHAMATDRVATGHAVGAGKTSAKGRDESKRAQVTATLQKVFDATKKDVEDTLCGLDKKVDDQFSREEKQARGAFTDEHKQRMQEYKDKRYSGLSGKWRWVRDKFLGLPDEANQIFVVARDHYVARMQTVISNVADTIGRELDRAKARIAKGRDDLKAAVAHLPADLRAMGAQAADEFAGRFDELNQQVDEKGTDLVQTLASKYNEALKSVDDEIAKEKEKNKGLVQKAVDAVKGVIKTILELKNLLLGVLRKAASAVMLILKDPIGFLRNLVGAVGAGLKQFLKNIVKHLEQGLMSWLLGVTAQAGLSLPKSFDVKGILMLIAGLLGLTWQFIRSRIVRKIPEKVVAAVETGVTLIMKIRREGIAGLWDEIKTQIGDLKHTLISKVTEYLIPTIIVAGIMWVLSLLNPASAFVRACKLIIDVIQFIVERGRQIIDFVNAVLDAVIAIAKGGSGGVPGLIENALARSIPVLIGFLASLLGIGGIADKVKKIFQTLSKPVAKAVDWVVDKIVGLVKKLWAKLKRLAEKAKRKLRKATHKANVGLRRFRDKARGGDDSPAGQLTRLNAALAAGVNAVNRYRGRPVAGKILKPLLTVIRIRYGLAVLAPVVSGDHWAVYGRVNPDGKRDTEASTEGQQPTGANPNFTADAQAFEHKLAAKAAVHPAANSALRTMAGKVKSYLTAAAGSWEHGNAKLAAFLGRVAAANVELATRSGAVVDLGRVAAEASETKKQMMLVKPVMAVFDRGTLTERFVHIISFYSNVLGSHLADPAMAEQVLEWINAADLDLEFLLARSQDIQNTAHPSIRDLMAPVPRGSAVEIQSEARIKRLASGSREIGLRIGDVGLRMSPREVAMQRTLQEDWDRHLHTLKWHVGSRDWRIREGDEFAATKEGQRAREWVRQIQSLGLPLAAGPSGTTNVMMNVAVAFRAEPYATRLACIAFLVGARHHSLVEVLAAAKPPPFGCDYTEGTLMYRNIQPLSEKTLRACGDGKFPDEVAPPEKGSRP
jgi:hypothetical protein